MLVIIISSLKRQCYGFCPSSATLQQQQKFRLSRTFFGGHSSKLFSTIEKQGKVVQDIKQRSDGDDDLPRILLKRSRQSKAFRDGSQLIFPGSIDKTIPNGRSLDLASFIAVEVPSSNDKDNDQTQVVGWGVFNPHSMYRVRILCHAHPTSSLSQALKKRNVLTEDPLSLVLASKLQRALDVRRSLNLPSNETDTYRMVNGEGDGLSGLAVDIVGGQVAVVMSSAAWCQVNKDKIIKCLQTILPNFDIIWKITPSRLKQDGYELSDDDDDDDDGDHDDIMNDVHYNDNDRMVIGMENNVKFETHPYQKGQKTSVYCDQRENRQILANFCKDKYVLDLCCYHGGFSLSAAINGATHVIGVDSSQDAINTCQNNAKLNGLSNVEFVRQDISDYMKEYVDNGYTQLFDVIVLDPPKLAPSVSSLDKAKRKYHSLNRDALKLIADSGGLFMTCTCSAAMTQKDGGQYFLQVVQQASLAAGREITLVGVTGAAPCHTQSPASFPAGNYLTAALFRVHPKC